MNTIAKIGTTLAIGFGIALAPAAAPADPDGISLACATAEDCRAVIDVLYSDAKQLGAEVNDLRDIRARTERAIARKDARIERRNDRIKELRKELREARQR